MTSWVQADDADCKDGECDFGGDAEIQEMAKALKKKLSEMKQKFRVCIAVQTIHGVEGAACSRRPG